MSPSPRVVSRERELQTNHPATEITIHLTPFDQKEYRQLIEARGDTAQHVVTRLKPALGLANAVDAGCGVGFFSHTLAECGLNVCGFDGREENVTEARRRFPFRVGQLLRQKKGNRAKSKISTLIGRHPVHER